MGIKKKILEKKKNNSIFAFSVKCLKRNVSVIQTSKLHEYITVFFFRCCRSSSNWNKNKEREKNNAKCPSVKQKRKNKSIGRRDEKAQYAQATNFISEKFKMLHETFTLFHRIHCFVVVVFVLFLMFQLLLCMISLFNSHLFFSSLAHLWIHSYFVFLY